MPTKTIKPQWGIQRPGYTPLKPLFNPEQIRRLAEILGQAPTDVETPLATAGLEIGPHIAASEATELEQAAALEEIADHSESLLVLLRGIDSKSKRKLVREYGGATTAEDGELELELTIATAAEASLAARADYANDIACLERLYGNVVVALKRMGNITGSPGRPSNWFEHFAARKLIDAYESITGEVFLKGRGTHRTFVLTALIMIGISQASAAGAITRALREKTSATSKQSPGTVG